jgi:hypothetical protein
MLFFFLHIQVFLATFLARPISLLLSLILSGGITLTEWLFRALG